MGLLFFSLLIIFEVKLCDFRACSTQSVLWFKLNEDIVELRRTEFMLCYCSLYAILVCTNRL